jgi:hypothetical protein
VTEREDTRNGGIQRYRVASQRTSVVGVITFDRLMRMEHIVRIVNLSVVGVGVESNERIEDGLVYFKKQIGGHKFGVVAWCRRHGDGYRAGINFTTLPLDQERHLLKQVRESRPHKPLRDPEQIIAALLESIKRETSGSQ